MYAGQDETIPVENVLYDVEDVEELVCESSFPQALEIFGVKASIFLGRYGDEEEVFVGEGLN